MRLGSPEYAEHELRHKAIYEYRSLVRDIRLLIEAGDDEHGGYHVHIPDWYDVGRLYANDKSFVEYAFEDALLQTRFSDISTRLFLKALEQLVQMNNVVPVTPATADDTAP